MANNIHPFQIERSHKARRAMDRIYDLQHESFSSPFCHRCIERFIDGVILLDNETKVIYATQQVDKILKRHDVPFALLPKFILHEPNISKRFTDFIKEKNTETERLTLLLKGDKVQDMLLFNCLKFPKSTEPSVQYARFMITLSDPNHFPSQNWLLFIKQFKLTQTESRLCWAFASGLTLNEYSEKWKVTPGTARTQLHSIFTKTYTHRQSDLLRLIFLFSRTYS